ncbi:tetratricopeptide repeat protein [Streptomyces sp. NPDC001002]
MARGNTRRSQWDEQRPSRGELIRSQEQEVFVGRHAERATFADNLSRDPAMGDFHWLFHVHGVGGVGKSTLVLNWQETARSHGALTAVVDAFEVRGVVEAMKAVGGEFAPQAGRLKDFDAEAARLDKLQEADRRALAPDGETPSPASQVAAQALMGATSLVPGASVLTGMTSPEMAARGIDRMRAAARDHRLRGRGSDEGAADPVARLSSAFVKELVRLAGRHPFLVLFFDTWEQAGLFLEEWVRDLLLDRFGRLPSNIVFVLAGRGPLDEREWARFRTHVTEVPLEVFTEREARGLLTARGVTDETEVASILDTALGLPLLLDVLARTRPSNPAAHEAIGEPVDIAVARFLYWIHDTVQRDAVLDCALPLQFNEDVFRAAVPPADAALFSWLCTQPFVAGRDGHRQYHDVVRTSMLRHQRARSPQDWIDNHTRLADAFAGWRTAHEADLAADKRWADGTWRGHRLNETYHRLCAHSAHLAAALEETIRAAGQDLPTLRRWADMLTRAGVDSDAAAVTDWGRRVSAAAAGEQGLVEALAALSTAPDLSAGAVASAHLYRGRHLYHGDREQEAITELGRAIDIDPSLAAAYLERGAAHRWIDHYDEAVADLTRSLELEPGTARAYALRGAAQLQRGLVDEAIADLDRALEANPRHQWALGQRGLAHLVAGNPARALADTNRALELDPDDDLALALRGEAHRRAGRLEEAIADLDRAVELDPEYAWAIAHRGGAHRQADRLEEALTDLNRALELDPQDDWALATRGVLHSDSGRPAEALADLDRAIELDPEYGWALAKRGVVHRLAKRLEEALADLNRAVELNPEDSWIVSQRGAVHEEAGRLDEAIADLNRALELDPEYGWALTQRGVVHRRAERLEEALADLNRAVELKPEDGWPVGERGYVHQLAGRLDEAMADFTRSIELDPGDPWDYAQRGRTHRLAERLDEAIADLSRAVELAPEFDEAFAWRGAVHRQAGRPAEAIADFDRALALDPDNTWYLSQRGWTHRQRGHYDHAHADFDRLTELDPGYPRAFFNRGETHRLSGRLDQAVADFTRALEIDPADDWARQQRAMAHQSAGRPAEARVDLRQVLAGEDADAMTRLQWVLLDSREHGLAAHREDWRALLDGTDGEDEDVVRLFTLLRALLLESGADTEALIQRLLEVVEDQEMVDEVTVWLRELEATPGDHVPEIRRLRHRLHDHRARL